MVIRTAELPLLNYPKGAIRGIFDYICYISRNFDHNMTIQDDLDS